MKTFVSKIYAKLDERVGTTCCSVDQEDERDHQSHLGTLIEPREEERVECLARSSRSSDAPSGSRSMVHGSFLTILVF